MSGSRPAQQLFNLKPVGAGPHDSNQNGTRERVGPNSSL